MSVDERPLQQHPNFAACLKAAKRDVLELPEGLILRRRILGVPVCLASRGSDALIAKAAELPGIRLFTGETSVPERLTRHGFIPLLTPATVAEWDITPEPENLRKALHGKWRNQLRRAEETATKITRCTAPRNPANWIYLAEAAQAKALGYKGFPNWISAGWATLFPKDAILFEARFDSQIIAAMLFLCHGKAATYQTAFSTYEARRLNTHRALLWTAALHLRDRGITRLDLGQVETEESAGLARFKLGTGAKARVLGGTWLALPGLATGLAQLSIH